jgi:hypothetical protein
LRIKKLLTSEVDKIVVEGCEQIGPDCFVLTVLYTFL